MKNRILIILFFLAGFSSKADTWLEPKAKEYYSQDSSYYVRIVPTKIPNKYYDWLNAKPRKKKKFSAFDTTIVFCHAIMFKRLSEKDSLIWKRKLINKIAPVYAIVSNDGKYMITLDNWYSMGFGIDVLVCYGANGDFQFRTNLEFISPFPINDYSRSISSIWWRCGERFINNTEFELCFIDDNEKEAKVIFDIEKLKKRATTTAIRNTG